MKITKIGHCCLLIKENGQTFLTDPGIFTLAQNDMTGIDVILITHEHADHFHIESLKKVLLNNPEASVITNKAVGKLLEVEDIKYEILEGQSTKMFGNVLVEAFDGKHEEIYPGVPDVQNTGYFIAGRLFYPGDSFFNPKKPVEILALPVVAPWLKISESINYALELKPKVVFPVHDGFLKISGPFYAVPKRFIETQGIEFREMEINKEIEL